MHMPPLQLPQFNAKLKEGQQGLEILDTYRKKYLKLTPEEWVRQHLLHWLTDHLGYQAARLSVEKSLNLNGMTRRYDAVWFDASGEKPIILIECKAAHVEINQSVFDQAARYNLVIDAPFMLLSNGISHYFAKINHQKGQYDLFDHVPEAAAIPSLLLTA